MSDKWIRLVPEDPQFIPDAEAQQLAEIRFVQIAPEAEIKAVTFDAIQFFDCGGNFERIRCPSCGKEIETNWWRDQMEKDFDGGFRLALYTLPCCLSKLTLNDLSYEGGQSFGRFALQALNADIGRLGEQQRKEFEIMLCTRLRVIYQHL
jgi:NAD-dependent SIR2 family protein deacetylase